LHHGLFVSKTPSHAEIIAATDVTDKIFFNNKPDNTAGLSNHMLSSQQTHTLCQTQICMFGAMQAMLDAKLAMCQPQTYMFGAMQAMLDAKLALEQDPKLLKAHHRLAQAQLGLESFKAAMQSAQAGQHLLDIKADRTTDFTILMDQIAMAGALKADYAGFDGRILQVNSLQPSLLP